MSGLVYKFVVYLANFIAVLVAVPCHEFAHAFAAVKCGDETPKYSGRYTLNPFAHFDPLGLVMMVLLGFGWARPVPVNPDNFRNYKKGCVWVSIAGVLTNLALALAFCPLTFYSGYLTIGAEWSVYLDMFVRVFISSLFGINVGLFVFNLLPLYPLDGFRLYDAVSTKRGKAYFWLRQNSGYIFIAILLLGYLADFTGIPYLDIIGVCVNYVEMAIMKLWTLILFGV